jgi:prepilin-type N-terminal cleavage/methylation domain-containing protein
MNILPNNYAVRGFSLVEMAVVLVILGFVITALLLPVASQRDQIYRTQTENQLEIARKALLGFAQVNGRLPCPATGTSLGTEQPNINPGKTACNQQLGFLPAATLGIQPSINGYLVDGWNNPIMYAVTQTSSGGASTPDFTSLNVDDPSTPLVNEADGMNYVGITSLASDLRVCHSSIGITANACSATTPETNYATNNAVAVIYSYGGTANKTSGGSDENANFHTDPSDPTLPHKVFVSHGITAATATSEEFDHMMVWISPYILYNAMINAGQLH